MEKKRKPDSFYFIRDGFVCWGFDLIRFFLPRDLTTNRQLWQPGAGGKIRFVRNYHLRFNVGDKYTKRGKIFCPGPLCSDATIAAVSLFN